MNLREWVSRKLERASAPDPEPPGMVRHPTFSVAVEDYRGGEIRYWPGLSSKPSPGQDSCSWCGRRGGRPVPWHLEVREFSGQVNAIYAAIFWRCDHCMHPFPGEDLVRRGRRILDDRWEVPLRLDGQLPIWDVRVYGHDGLYGFMAVGDPRAPTLYAAELAARMAMESFLSRERAWSRDLSVVVMGPRTDLDEPRSFWNVGGIMSGLCGQVRDGETADDAAKGVVRDLYARPADWGPIDPVKLVEAIRPSRGRVFMARALRLFDLVIDIAVKAVLIVLVAVVLACGWSVLWGLVEHGGWLP